jgi:hypothetical protein
MERKRPELNKNWKRQDTSMAARNNDQTRLDGHSIAAKFKQEEKMHRAMPDRTREQDTTRVRHRDVNPKRRSTPQGGEGKLPAMES